MKFVDQVDINVRLLASDIGVGKARLPFILSDKNNNPDVVRKELSLAIGKDASFIKIIDQENGFDWTSV